VPQRSAGAPIAISVPAGDRDEPQGRARTGSIGPCARWCEDGCAPRLALSLTQRFAEFAQRIGNRAVVERAKGILMERHDVAEQDAYEMLRRHARDGRQSLLSTAEAVLRARPLLPHRPKRDDAT
jgi:hypothetical protein